MCLYALVFSANSQFLLFLGDWACPCSLPLVHELSLYTHLSPFALDKFRFVQTFRSVLGFTRRLFFLTCENYCNSLMLLSYVKHKSKQNWLLWFSWFYFSPSSSVTFNISSLPELLCFLFMFFILAIPHLFYFPSWISVEQPDKKELQMRAIHGFIIMLKVRCCNLYMFWWRLKQGELSG